MHSERRFPSRGKSRSPPRPFWRRRRTAILSRAFSTLFLVCALAGAPPPLDAQEQITVFAAASLKNALDDVNAAFTKATGIKVVTSYEASSALAKQIEAGAPADVFISADLRWMDYAAEHKLVDQNTRANLL